MIERSAQVTETIFELFSEDNTQVDNHEEILTVQTLKLPDVEFKARDSLLTNLLQNNKHFQSIYSIFFVTGALIFLQNFLYDFIEDGSVNFGMDLVVFSLKSCFIAFIMWLGMFAVTLLVYPAFKLWVYSRKYFTSGPKRYFDIFSCAIFLCYLIGFGFVFTVAITSFKAGMLTVFVFLIEMFRFLMKSYGFVRSSSSTSQTSFRHFLYFLFCPALVYREVYPRNDKIHWRFVIKCFLEFIVCLWVISHVLDRYIFAPFRHFESITTGQFFLKLFACTFPAMYLQFIMWYATLHSWMNGFAEVTRFADREFYSDWWSSPNFAVYFKKWNIVVGNWLYTYVYKDFCETLAKGNKVVALLAVVLVSSISHEYILLFSFGFFYPIMSGLYLMWGFPLMLVNLSKSNVLSKIFFWSCMFIGLPAVFYLYSMEYHARQKCFGGQQSWNYFQPVSWSCNGIHLNSNWTLHWNKI